MVVAIFRLYICINLLKKKISVKRYRKICTFTCNIVYNKLKKSSVKFLAKSDGIITGPS